MLENPDQGILLFVYGTLMPGQGNHHQIESHVNNAQSGRIPGVLVDLGAYPALIPGCGVVEGIVLNIDRATLTITDRIEGYHPNRVNCLYVRRKAAVELFSGDEITAWTYEFARPHRIKNYPRLSKKKINGVPVYAWPASR